MELITNLFFVFLISLSYSNAELNTDWWKYTNIYQIILYSFKDSDGDGIGDLKGLTSKLDHFVEMKVETLYLTPIYKSPMKDMGYDVSDYISVNPKYGTMEDFEELVKEMNKRGMKLMLELVINHSSDKHDWFQKSIDQIEPYTDYYVWVNPKNYSTEEDRPPMEPNNWRTFFQTTSWTWNGKRQQFYYHKFLKEQPDLNLRNENVKVELKNVIKFWLDKGVSGFRLDAPMCYIEDKYLRDEDQGPFSLISNTRSMYQRESFEFIHELRVFVDDYNREHGGCERFISVESHGVPFQIMQFFGTKEYPIAHFIFMYNFQYIRSQISAITYDALINFGVKYVEEGNVLSWVSENHDQPRTANRLCPEYKDILTTTIGLLPGIVHYYYGQEIGAENGYVQTNQIIDQSFFGLRDPGRLLMQWDDSINAGFSTNETTITPLNANYYERNVAFQRKQKSSHYQIFKTINTLRQTETIKYGNYQSFIYSAYIHIFWRSYEKEKPYFVITNLSDRIVSVNLRKIPLLPRKLQIVTASVNADYEEDYIISHFEFNEFKLKPFSCVVISSLRNLWDELDLLTQPLTI